MQRVIIVTDPGADIAEPGRFGIEVVPLRISRTDQENEYLDTQPQTDQMVEELIRTGREALLKTSGVNPFHFVEAFQRAVEGGRDVVALIASQQLSVMWNAACLARDQLLEERPNATIELVDVGTGLGGQTALVMAAAKAARDGWEASRIVRMLKNLLPYIHSWVATPRADMAQRGGRLRIPEAEARALVGRYLIVRVTPLAFEIVERDGQPVVENSLDDAVDSLAALVKEHHPASKPMYLAVTHSGASEAARALVEKIAADLPCTEVYLGAMGAGPKVHFGKGALDLGLCLAPE